MHNAAGHYAEADKVATQDPLCRSCSMWYLVAALNAVVSFDQPHSKRQILDAEISGCSCKNKFGLKPLITRIWSSPPTLSLIFFAWLLHYWAEFKISICILVISIYILVIYN